MTTSIINANFTTKKLPIFSTNISHFKQILDLAAKAIFEEKERNNRWGESNVKSYFTSSHSSHLNNPNFQPLIDLVLSCVSEVSNKFFNANLKFQCYNCWGMLYQEGDYAIKHSHFPSTFAAVVYLDFEKESAPIIFEDDYIFTPEPGSLIIFPAILHHEVPKTKGKRMVVAMNIDHIKDKK